MDITRINDTSQQSATPDIGRERAAALAEARRKAGAAALQSASEARNRQAEQFAEARDIIARAVGADTRIAIQKNEDAGVFMYQAIDMSTGKVVQEWPPEAFVDFINSIEQGAGDRLAGLLVDSEA